MAAFRLIHADNLTLMFREYADIRYIQVDRLHSLPRRSAGMAGVALVEGKTVSLADLALLLGRPPLKKERNLHALVFGSHNSRLGLVWSGDQETVESEWCREFALPACLRNTITEACVYYKKLPIPLINLKALQKWVKKGESQPQNPELVFLEYTQKPPAYRQVRIFGCRGQRFALDASDVAKITGVPRQVITLPCTPDYVTGVTLHNGQLIPVLDIGDLLKLPNPGKPGSLIILRMQESIIGLLAGSPPGGRTTKPSRIYPLPPLAGAAYMHSIIRQGQKLVPCLEVAGLFQKSSTPKHTDSYTVSSEFPAQFLKQNIEVVEFSLFGVKHAVPKSEVEETIPYTPGTSLPLKLPILTGVKARGHLIVPVIDIARCFDVVSFADKTWKLLYIKNGDFRAMVLTERVFGSKTLPVSEQRELPLSLPLPLVYGCYTTGQGVVLILNIRTLAVNFQEQQAQDFYKALFEEFFRVYVHDLRQQHVKEAGPVPVYTEEEPEDQPAEFPAQDRNKTSVTKADADDRTAGASASAGGAEESGAVMAEAGDLQTPDNTDQTVRTFDTSVKRGVRTETPKADTSSADRDAHHTLHLPAGKGVPSNVPSAPGGNNKQKKRLLLAAGLFGALMLAGAVFFLVPKYNPIYPPGKSRIASTPTSDDAVSGPPSASGRQEENTAGAEQDAHFPAAEQDGQPPAERKNAQDTAEATRSGLDDTAPSSRIKPRQENTAAKTVTQDHAVEYRIQWGDTLARIAQRFTGNPYDYKRIAKDNKIKDPDFILAGDEIKIIIRK